MTKDDENNDLKCTPLNIYFQQVSFHFIIIIICGYTFFIYVYF